MKQKTKLLNLFCFFFQMCVIDRRLPASWLLVEIWQDAWTIFILNSFHSLIWLEIGCSYQFTLKLFHCFYLPFSEGWVQDLKAAMTGLCADLGGQVADCLALEFAFLAKVLAQKIDARNEKFYTFMCQVSYK